MGIQEKLDLSYEGRKKMLRQAMRDLAQAARSLYEGRLQLRECAPHWEMVPSDLIGLDDWVANPSFQLVGYKWRWWLGFIPYREYRVQSAVLIGHDPTRQVHVYLFNHSLKSIVQELIGKYAKEIYASRVVIHRVGATSGFKTCTFKP